MFLPLFYADLEKMVEPTSGSAPPLPEVSRWREQEEELEVRPAGMARSLGAGLGAGGPRGPRAAASLRPRSGAGGAPSLSGSESGVGRPALVRAAPVRPSVPARVPRRRVTGPFPGPGIPLPGTVRSAFRWI